METETTLRIKRLDNIVLMCKDLKRSVPYYQDLGLRLIYQQGNEIAIFQLGDIRLLLHPLSERFRPPPERAAAIYGLEVGDVEGLHASYEKRGLKITEIRDQAWGAREFYLTDPDGHVLALFQPSKKA